MKINLSLLTKELMKIKEKLDDDNLTVDTEDTEDSNKFDKSYDEINNRTRNFNPVSIKDYERNMNPKLKTYRNLFIDKLDDETTC